MRGFFDDGELEPVQPKRDTELTLGFGTLMAIFFGLVLVCGLCFGLGYEVGRSNSGPTAILPPGTPAKPSLQSSAIPKPNAIPQSYSAPQAQPGGAAASMVAQGFGSPAGSDTYPAAQPPANAAQVKPALPYASAQPAPQVAKPALPSGPLLVQIAAVANPEDGEVLVTALKKRGYAVNARREPTDNLIHVSIGPFGNRDEANRWRQKLLNDGYNAIVMQ
jgi:cell division septation protein DedD